MKILFNYYGPAILWALFIFIMCSIKLSESLTHAPIFFPGFDKLTHCGFFFVLVILYSYGLIRQQSTPYISYKAILMFTAAAIVYGGAIELLQFYFFTWRSGEWADLFADAVGASMGAFSIILTVNAYSGYVKK